MKADPPPRTSVVVSLALLIASLITLYAGGFIQFDDTSGFGYERWVMALGVVAGLLALSAVGVGLSDRRARRAVGGALAALDVVLAAETVRNDGFRFIWGGDEGESFFFQVALGLAALILLTPTFVSARPTTDETPRAGRSLTPWARFSIYLSALTLGIFVAFFLGIAHFEATQCSGPGGGECDVAVVEGFFWAGGAFVLGVVAVVLAEVHRYRKRRGAQRRD